MDKLDETIEVFCCDLNVVSKIREGLGGCTRSIVLLVEVVHVSVENLNEELHGYCGVHACISDTKRTL